MRKLPVVLQQRRGSRRRVKKALPPEDLPRTKQGVGQTTPTRRSQEIARNRSEWTGDGRGRDHGAGPTRRDLRRDPPAFRTPSPPSNSNRHRKSAENASEKSRFRRPADTV